MQPPAHDCGPGPGGDVRRFGLCGNCAHAQTLDSKTGSRFLFCLRARQDPRYAKYPPVPVFACAGFEPRAGREDGAGG
jgi:hypothetical protein